MTEMQWILVSGYYTLMKAQLWKLVFFFASKSHKCYTRFLKKHSSTPKSRA